MKPFLLFKTTNLLKKHTRLKIKTKKIPLVRGYQGENREE
jgi:hypothetical protein